MGEWLGKANVYLSVLFIVLIAVWMGMWFVEVDFSSTCNACALDDLLANRSLAIMAQQLMNLTRQIEKTNKNINVLSTQIEENKQRAKALNENLVCPRHGEATKVGIVVGWSNITYLKQYLNLWKQYYPCNRFNRDYDIFRFAKSQKFVFPVQLIFYYIPEDVNNMEQNLNENINPYTYTTNFLTPQQLDEQIKNLWDEEFANYSIPSSIDPQFTLSQCFSSISFLNSRDSFDSKHDSSDFYHSYIHPKNRNFLYLLHTLSSSRFALDYFLFLPQHLPDQFISPSQNRWLEKIYWESVCGEDFWMKGSNWKTNSLYYINMIATQMNDTAIYNTRDKAFKEWLKGVVKVGETKDFDFVVWDEFTKRSVWANANVHLYKQVDWMLWTDYKEDEKKGNEAFYNSFKKSEVFLINRLKPFL